MGGTWGFEGRVKIAFPQFHSICNDISHRLPHPYCWCCCITLNVKVYFDKVKIFLLFQQFSFFLENIVVSSW